MSSNFQYFLKLKFNIKMNISTATFVVVVVVVFIFASSSFSVHGRTDWNQQQDTQFNYNSIVPTLENLAGKTKEFYNMFVAPVMEKCAKRHLRRHQGYAMKKKRICGTMKQLRALFIRLNEIGREDGQKIYDIDILPQIREVINHDDSDTSYGHFSNSLLYAISQYIFPQDHTAD